MERTDIVTTKTKARKPPRRRTSPTVDKYIVTDGELVLYLEPCEEGGYCVTSPFVDGLVTEGEALEECFEMAHDAATLLREVREEMAGNGKKQARATRAS